MPEYSILIRDLFSRLPSLWFEWFLNLKSYTFVWTVSCIQTQTLATTSSVQVHDFKCTLHFCCCCCFHRCSPVRRIARNRLKSHRIENTAGSWFRCNRYAYGWWSSQCATTQCAHVHTHVNKTKIIFYMAKLDCGRMRKWCEYIGWKHVV